MDLEAIEGRVLDCESLSNPATIRERQRDIIRQDVPALLARVRELSDLMQEALPFIKTVSRSGNVGYDEQHADLYERMVAALVGE